MGRKAGGASGGGTAPPPPPSAPATPVVNTLANAANVTLTFDLAGVDRVQNALTQCSVKCATNVLPLGAVGDVFAGPCYAELWLVRDAGGFAMQLDSGFVQGGAERTTIGVVGSIMYVPGDQLVVMMWNDSGAAFIYKVEYATDVFDPDLVASTGAYTKLSKKHEATWVYEVTILNDGAAAGNHVVGYAFADGLIGSPSWMYVYNQDTVARAAGMNLEATIAIVLALNAALGAGAGLLWPVGTTYPGIGATFLIPPSWNVIQFVNAVAISQDSLMGSVFNIQARPPIVTLTSPAGSTRTVTAGFNEVR